MNTTIYPTKEAILTAKYTPKHDVIPTKHPKTEEELENEFFGDGNILHPLNRYKNIITITICFDKKQCTFLVLTRRNVVAT